MIYGVMVIGKPSNRDIWTVWAFNRDECRAQQEHYWVPDQRSNFRPYRLFQGLVR